MPHTVRHANAGNTAFAQVTFTGYVAGQGGEQFTLAEFGLTGTLVDVQFFQMLDATNRQNNAMFCQLMTGGKVMLVYPSGLEFPTNPSMNFTVFCVVQGS
jgi:hypothetical protein